MLEVGTSGSQRTNRAGRLYWVVPLLLAATVLTVFMPTVGFDFTNYDEREQLIENPYIRGLSAGNLVDIFTHFSITSYYPIRLLSFAIDHESWGLDPRGYHLTNVLIHVVNVLLLFYLGLRLAGAPEAGVGGHAPEGAAVAPAESKSRKSKRDKREPGGRPGPASVHDRRSAILGGVAAGLFGLHPVVVEPVSWVAGREELLMVLFTLGCVHLHVSARRVADRPAKAGRRLWNRAGFFHVLAGICCACACMSNVVGAIIPAMVVAYDLAVSRTRSVRRIAGGTWFLFAIAAGTVILKQLSESIALAKGGPAAPGALSLFRRGLAVADGYGHNLGTLVWPRGLIVRYANILPAGFFEPGVLSGTALVLVTPLLLWCVRRHRLVLFGLLWFLLGLAPSSQVIPHHILCADRFLYLPLVGLSLAVAAGILHLPRPGLRTVVTVAGTLLVLGALAAGSALQVQVWRNSVVLWSHCIRWNPCEAQAYYNRGIAYADNGEQDRALLDYNAAIQFKPDYADAYSNRGVLYAEKAQYDQAVADFSRAIELKPDDAGIIYNRGLAYCDQGRHDRAIEDFTKVIELTPDYAAAYNKRAVSYANKGEHDRALADLERALQLAPDYAEAYNTRGAAYAHQGEYDRAMADLERALQLDPQCVDAYNNRGLLYAGRGQYDRAIAEYSQALAVKSDYAKAYNNRGVAYGSKGDYDRAIADLTRAISLAPNDAKAYSNRGTAYHGKGQYDLARQDFEQALRLDPAGPAGRAAGQYLQSPGKTDH